MKKRFLALTLAVILCLGLVPSALAYTTPDFSDLPSDNWAYGPVMRMADQGIIQGTGGGMFSPTMKVSAAQFLTLVGRIVFPETVVGANDTWYGPYVSAAQSGGLLAGTQVDANAPESEITRYDMAVVLRAAAKKLGKAETLAQQSQVTDFGMIPNMYTEAVLAVYGMGLITGDQNGSFNGANTMMRNELATVIDRLVALKAPGGSSTEPGTSTDPEKPAETERPTESEKPTTPPAEAKMVSYSITGNIRKTDHVIGRPVDDKHTYLPNVPFKVYYTDDGGITSTLVAEGVTGNKEGTGDVLKGEGKGQFALTLELPEDAFSGSNRDEKGIYVSADTRLDGQRLVSSDLRTDGREYIELWRPSSESNGLGGNYRNIELTPPDGEKAKFTFQGYIEGYVPGEMWLHWLPGFTVRLFLADGSVIGETVSQSDGTFSMECEVDALDGGFDKMSKLYYYTASGYIDGVKYEYDAKFPASGNLMLQSLVTLHIVNEVGPGAPKNPNYRIVISPDERVGS